MTQTGVRVAMKEPQGQGSTLCDSFVTCGGIAMAPPTAYYWHPHGISWRGIGYHGTAWHATGGTMAPPTVTATTSPTALHGNPTACHGNPRGTTVSTAPRVGVRVRVRVRVRARVPWYAGEVRGSFRCMPWKVLPQVVPRQCNGMSRKITIMCIAHGAGRNRTLLVSLVHG